MFWLFSDRRAGNFAGRLAVKIVGYAEPIGKRPKHRGHVEPRLEVFQTQRRPGLNRGGLGDGPGRAAFPDGSAGFFHFRGV